MQSSCAVRLLNSACLAAPDACGCGCALLRRERTQGLSFAGRSFVCVSRLVQVAYFNRSLDIAEIGALHSAPDTLGHYLGTVCTSPDIE